MELPKYPIGIVRGNWFRLHHPLEKVVWTESNKTIVDYIPQEGDKLTVTLQGAYTPYEMENVTIEGNVLKYENNGTLPCGLYDVVINVVLADGKRLRSHQDCIVKIVKTNKEASIPDYVEFGVDTYELDGAVFMYVPNGEGGGGDMSNYYTKDESDARYLQNETDPTVPAWAKQETKPTYTAQEVGALPANTPIPSASDTTPSMDGVGSAGSTTTFARADHQHPSDTTKQDVINDLADIRSGASKGNTAYQLPQSGIPKTDLASDVQTSLGKADNAIQKSSSSTGLLKPNGDVDNNTYLTQHQDISGKANTSDLSNVAFSGDYDDLENKPTIPVAGDENIIEEVQVNGVALVPDANKAVNVQVPSNYPIVEDTTSTSINATIEPNKFYVWKVPLTGNSTITLGTEISGVMNEFLLQFSIATGSTPQISFSSNNIQWAGIDTYRGGKTYQVSIVNGYAIGVEFDTIVSQS